jgi:phosphodiesterase/alkaline phosphatase D-like protein
MRKVETCFLAIMVVLAMTLIAQAQDESPQKVQITKGPRVESVTNDTAVIAWSTNVNASTLVRYGTEQQKLTATAEAPWGGLTHRVTIRNLRPGTAYYFQAESNQGQGTGSKAVSDVARFSTRGQTALPQGGGPEASDSVQILAGPVPQKITDHSVELWWESDRPSDTIVKFGTTEQDLSEIKQKPWGDQTHHIELSGLQSGTRYFVAVVNAEGEVRSRASFSTIAGSSGPHIVDGPRIEFLAHNSAVIAWTTDLPSTSVIRYGPSAQKLDESADGAAGLTHRVIVRRLQPNTTYYFSAESAARDSATSVSSGVAPFRTVSDSQQALHLAAQR